MSWRTLSENTLLTIRPVRPEDIDALYSISLATGNEGRDASHLYDDPKLMGHIYCAAYVTLAPELAVVVEDSQGIAGFCVGALNTTEWETRLENDWWPQLRQCYVNPPEAFRASWTPDQRRASMIHQPAQTPPEVACNFPSHLHMNLLPRAQGSGLGAKLFDTWRKIAIKHSPKAMHVGVNRANHRAVHFWGKLGFAALSVVGTEQGRTIWMGRA